MNCPKCGTFLREVIYENVLIHTCDGCGGEVMGPEEIRHIVVCRDDRFTVELLDQLNERVPLHGIPTDAFNRSLSCPSCQCHMEVINYGNDSGIIIDRCEECNTIFLDHEELEKIQIIMERWNDEAPIKIKEIAEELERSRRETAEETSRAFASSRFAFVNAVINHFLDAA